MPVDVSLRRHGPAPAPAPAPATRRKPPGTRPSHKGNGLDTAPSEDIIALAFVDRHPDHRFVAPWHRWLKWDGRRWREDSTGHVFERIRQLVREWVQGGKPERSTANAAFVAGVERLLRFDQRLVLVPEQLDADPWTLNTPSGLVDLRTGALRPHDPAALCTRITAAALEPAQGAALWRQFLEDVTRGDAELAAYLQRVAGYGATGSTREDVLVFPFGPGANGKTTWAEALGHALGDYARTFAPEVLMEAKGERHPTELAQFIGVRLAFTSEPASGAAWNDSRIKQLTGDSLINARFMRGDPFEFPRTHKTVIVGNHVPRLHEVTPAIRRRLHLVPFEATFDPRPGEDMRARLKAEAGGAILAWAVEGAREWATRGTCPPERVRALTAEYLSEQDVLGQWLDACCERSSSACEALSRMYGAWCTWCEEHGLRPGSNLSLSSKLRSAGFVGRRGEAGVVFAGLRLKG